MLPALGGASLPPGTKYFEVTVMGAAVHSSGLPIGMAIELYKR